MLHLAEMLQQVIFSPSHKREAQAGPQQGFSILAYAFEVAHFGDAFPRDYGLRPNGGTEIHERRNFKTYASRLRTGCSCLMWSIFTRAERYSVFGIACQIPGHPIATTANQDIAHAVYSRRS